MILFLKQVSRQADGTRGWEGANPQGLGVSLAWVEGSGPYEIVQTMNPGDAAIIQDYASEQALKEVFLELDATRTALERALALSDRAARANALVPLANTRLTRTQDAVFDALGKCGPEAIPALRVILRDATEFGVDTRAIEAMGRAGGDVAAAELLALLRVELAFWKGTARELDGVPVIPQETLTQAMLDPESHVSIGPWTEERRRQHDRTVATLYALEALHPRSGLEVVRELKDVWRSLPQLQQKGVHDSLAAECDAILTHPAESRN